ncbi:MAG: right-handed parallel beta-helix repeat-containing protein, partial [bacterium]
MNIIRRFFILTILTVVIVCGIQSATAKVVYVSLNATGDGSGSSWENACTSISIGLNRSVSGDEIWVAAGRYLEVVHMEPGVALYGGFLGIEQIRDERDWAANETIIDATGLNTSAVIAADETVLDGLTVTGGRVYCAQGSSVTIANCIITENNATGVSCMRGSSVTITDCAIMGNTNGGVICDDGSSVTITDSSIIGNTSEGLGGVYCRDGSSVMCLNCTITENLARPSMGLSAGGVNGYGFNLINCRITKNSGDIGGVNGYGCSLIDCLVAENEGNMGGACWLENAAMTNCTIAGNTGGACWLENAAMTNCTITGNCTIMENFVGVTITGGRFTLLNCIISGNSGDVVVEGGKHVSDCVITGNSASSFAVVDCFTLTNCLIAGNSSRACGFSSHATLTNCTIAGNSGGGCTFGSQGTLTNCILWNPRDEIEGNANVTYTCIEGGWSGEGNTDAYPEFVDLVNGDYHLRNGSPCVDTGLVSAAPTEDIEGRDRPGSDGFVDMGAYESPPAYAPDDEEWEPSPLDRVYVRSGAPEGGDGSSWESALNSIRKALLKTSRNGEVWVASGTYHEKVFMVEGVDMYAGFSGNEEAREQRNWAANQTIIDAAGLGGSAVIGANDAILDGFTVTGGGGEWGGVRCQGTSPTLINCTIAGNSGGVYCYESFLELINCTITGNTAIGGGGGIFCNDSSPTLTNCTISENRCERAGGGVYCWESSPTLTNCSFFGNSGALACDSRKQANSSTVEMVNSILWDNGNEISNYDNSTITISYSDIQSGYPGVGNIDADPLFIDADNGDFHLQNGSPCIDAGDPDPSYNDACLPPGLGTERCDMGAYGG